MYREDLSFVKYPFEMNGGASDKEYGRCCRTSILALPDEPDEEALPRPKFRNP